MQTSRVSSCNENFVSIRILLELRSLQESVSLQTPSHLTAPTCSGSMRSDIVWVHATSDVPRIDRKCETTKLSRSSSSQLSLNQTKRLSTWRSVTPPISSAGNRDIAFAAEKLCADKLFALDSDGRCSIHRSRRKKAFFLMQAAPRGREQVICLSAVSQATFPALGTKRVGKMQRQIGVWGWLWHLQWGSGWFWCPQATIRSKKVIKVWIFRIFRRSCILRKWGAHQAAEFRQEPRRSTTDLYRCFLWTGRPPKTANPRDSGLFCLLLLRERPFLPRPVNEIGHKSGISRRSLCMVSLYFAQCAGKSALQLISVTSTRNSLLGRSRTARERKRQVTVLGNHCNTHSWRMFLTNILI